MTKMIATKGFTYGTRRLAADEPFAARSRQDARVLFAIGRARYETADGRAGPAPAPSAPIAKPAPKKAATPKKTAAPRRPKQA